MFLLATLLLLASHTGPTAAVASPDTINHISGRIAATFEYPGPAIWIDTDLPAGDWSRGYRRVQVSVVIRDSLGANRNLTTFVRQYEDARFRRQSFRYTIGDSINCDYFPTGIICTLRYLGTPGGRDRRLE